MSKEINDLVIIGGSYAGMSAALQLVRARRKVVIIDEGIRRNRFAKESHGFLGSDGASPNEIAATARGQLLKYPTLQWIDGRAISVEGTKDNFVITTADKQEYRASRILLATGIQDCLSDIEGLEERWGKSVFHCPYCHGYELNQGNIAVIATSPMSIHQGLLLPEWGTITFYTNGTKFGDDMLNALESKSMNVVHGIVQKIENEADVILEDGSKESFTGIFVSTTVKPTADELINHLGCDMLTNPLGSIVKTDEKKQSSKPGVYACGDVGVFPSTVALAVGDGTLAGFNIHRCLLGM
ncbi:NAD(P)/FAD-dependent oxidoreductase [Kluyveromyces lactis]|uniref:KLLA0F15037p n=1 Tax=Kluyveromyces lactis (strain ATCC 8585 / CBS 2359 / DSM 70799 / NBRC 1267 / NRRL Y-1140 / WM37) TaxID=284590 RepID=Q6CJY3_KLULA|nr:uncharacterized protein KLLA0_F15037g [Kluyveromyces lactis]CAG98464.1 KLLA0F15037p [Kluyveromyces lactis]|eukprot:XP_455756.1 uncharacterized protein KLLA0_F15037g [Kluyveromyces lactis]